MRYWKHVVLSLLSLAMVMIIGNHPVAAAEENEAYLDISIGIQIPAGSLLKNGSGFAAEGIGGVYVCDKYTTNVGVEGAIGYQKVKAKKNITLNEEGDIDSQTIYISPSIRIARQLFGTIDVYAAAGPGLFMNKVSISTSQGTANANAVFSLGGIAKAGAAWLFDEGLTLGMEGRYQSTSVKFDKNIGGTRYNADISLDGYTVAFTIGYAF